MLILCIKNMIFKKSELKRKISMLLIVALTLGMTNSHFAISDLELSKNENTVQSHKVNEENIIDSLSKENKVAEVKEELNKEKVEVKEELENKNIVKNTNKPEEVKEVEKVAEKSEEVLEKEEEIKEEDIEEPEEPEEIKEEDIEEPEERKEEEIEYEEEKTAEDKEENIENDEATVSEIEKGKEEEIEEEESFESEKEEEVIEEVKTSTESEVKEEREEEVKTSTISITELEIVISTPSLFSAPAHTHGSDVYVEINSESDLTSITTSYVYLGNDIKLSNEINLSQFDNKELHICLNGKTLKYENGVTIFDVSNEEKLYISDCNTHENAGHIVSTESTAYDSSYIRVSGTGEVTVDNINLNELDLNGSFIEAIDGGQVVISDVNLEHAIFKKAVLYAKGIGSKISFVNTNYIGINTVENDSILFAENGACIEITSGETKVKSNSSKTGGVMHLANHSKFVLSGTLIASANNAEKGGFAYIDNTVSFQTSSGEIDIEEGIANYGGGLYIEIVNDENFFNNPMIYNIKNNKANNDGGGVYLDFKVDANFIPNMQGTFNLEKNEGGKGAGLYIGSSEGKKKVEIKNINFNNHKLNENESLIETNIDADISNLKIESINKDADALGQLISNGTLIRACANDNKITISNIFLANATDKINRANKGIELTKESNKTIDLTISTYSLLDKIAFGIDIANIADDNQSKVTLNNIYTDYSANYEEFLVPQNDDFPRPENFYTQLSYLQGNGTKALDLDYIPNFTTRWDISYQFNAGSVGIGAAPYCPGHEYANSGYNVTGRFGFVSLSGNDHIQCAFGGSASSYYYHCYHNQRHNMYIDAYNKKASNGADTINGNARGMNFNNPGRFVGGVKSLYIFGVNSSHGVRAHAGSVWSSKIQESGVLIRDFIPIELTKDIPRSMDRYGVSRESGSKGLWDKVNEEFYEYTSGIATYKIAETGIYIFNSTIPVTFNNLCINGTAKRSVYIEKSKNINFIA